MSGNENELTPEISAGHWNKTFNLMLVATGLWLFFSFIVHVIVQQSPQTIIFADFPLAFYMAAQGSLLAFLIILFWFANAQNKIDEEFGVAE